MMRLHGYFRSGTSYRVRIALNLKGVPYETVPVNLPERQHRSAAFRALNPQGLVPVLETGEGTFTQSVAILEYLEERYPDPPLLPAERGARARVRALAAIIGSDVHPINNLRVLNYLRQHAVQPEDRIAAWVAHWIHEGFAAFETMLGEASTPGEFCHGSSPTLADVYLIPQVHSANRFGVDLAAYPRIQAIDARCATEDAFARAHPQRQIDA